MYSCCGDRQRGGWTWRLAIIGLGWTWRLAIIGLGWTWRLTISMRGRLGFLGVGGLGAEPGNLMYFLFHRMMLRLTSPSFVRPSGVAISISRSAKSSTMSSTVTRA